MSDEQRANEQYLTDPDNEHRPAESEDEPTQTERAQIAEHGSPDDMAVLAAFRAGWDQGVADRAQRAHRERVAAPREINTPQVRQALVAEIADRLAGSAAIIVGAGVLSLLDRASAGLPLREVQPDPEPEVTTFGFRWRSASGRWHVDLNRHGDVYVSDSRVPAPEVAELEALIGAARGRAEDLMAEIVDDDEGSPDA